MFSQSQRCCYQKNQLGNVICQLRFPEILAIEANAPVAFQEAIRGDYPGYEDRREAPAPKITGVPGNLTLQNAPATHNYQFQSADGIWKVNLTSRFLSLACTRYTDWEDFARRLDKPLVAFIQVYRPVYFERIGLRYLNFFSRKDLGLEGIPFSQLFAPCYLGPLGEEDVAEESSAQCSIDAQLRIRGGCQVKIHAGPGLLRQGNQVADREVKFIFDQDLFMPGKIAVNLSAGALETLHSQADSIFRGAITELLHNAMEPEEI